VKTRRHIAVVIRSFGMIKLANDAHFARFSPSIGIQDASKYRRADSEQITQITPKSLTPEYDLA